METPKAAYETRSLARVDRPWVAWTRYPLGRWRRTFLGVSPKACRAAVRNSYGTSVETVVLPEGEEPILTGHS
jgi:hypothetical protein